MNNRLTDTEMDKLIDEREDNKRERRLLIFSAVTAVGNKTEQVRIAQRSAFLNNRNILIDRELNLGTW